MFQKLQQDKRVHCSLEFFYSMENISQSKFFIIFNLLCFQQKIWLANTKF